MRKVMLIGSVVAIGVANLGVETAWAAPPVNATGSLHCAITGKAKYSPPLSRGSGAEASQLKVRLVGTGCTGTSGISSIKGKLTAEIPVGSCNHFPDPYASQLVLKFKGAGKYASSTTSFTSSELVPVYEEPATVNLPGSGSSSVGAGSFAGRHPTLKLVFDQTGAQITYDCYAAKGKEHLLKKLAVVGGSSFDIS
jgi:hypothetical protein